MKQSRIMFSSLTSTLEKLACCDEITSVVHSIAMVYGLALYSYKHNHYLLPLDVNETCSEVLNWEERGKPADSE